MRRFILASLLWQLSIPRGRVGDEALGEFLEAGYTQQNALDVVLGVSLASLCNYANNLANTPINPELQPYA